MRNDDLLHKWMERRLTEEEAKIFAQRPEYVALQAVERGTRRLSAPPFAGERILRTILSSTKSSAPARRLGLRRLLPYAVAAAVLLLAGFFYFWSSALTTYSTGVAERLTQTLPDGSRVRLNADSELRLADDWPERRVTRLNGEAFFEVTPGDAFTVDTPTGEVRVVGTSFNVVSRDGLLEVTCYTGRVVVELLAEQLRHTLNAGEGARFSATDGWTTWSLEEDAAEPGWTTGVTRLRAVPLRYALAELARQFEFSFKTNNVDLDKIVTVNFQHEDAAQALLTVLRPLNIRYEEKTGRQVHLFQE